MKAVLVIDKSDGCGNCPCSGEEFGMCQAVNNEKECDYYNTPSWCPLRPLPEECDDKSPIYNAHGEIDCYQLTGYARGWNDCLAEITGESNGKSAD